MSNYVDFLHFFFCLVLLLISAIFASPGVTPKTKSCDEDCPEFKPVCAGPKGATDKEKRSFGSDCVVRKYNCEKNEGLNISNLFQAKQSHDTN